MNCGKSRARRMFSIKQNNYKESKIIYKIRSYCYYYDEYTMTAQTWYIAMYCNKKLIWYLHNYNSNRDGFQSIFTVEYIFFTK